MPTSNGKSATLSLVAILAISTDVAAAQNSSNTSTRDQLEKIQSQRDAAKQRVAKLESGARAVARELADIGADLTEAASKSRTLEEQIAQADQTINSLTRQSSALANDLNSNKTALHELLAALMVWRSRRPPALATPARSSADAVRAAILMSHAAPAIDQKARDVAARISKLTDMRSRIENRKETLAATELILDARRAQIEALAKEKRATAVSLSEQSKIERSRRDALAQQANDLQELLDTLASYAPKAPTIRPPAPKPAPAKTTKTSTKTQTKKLRNKKRQTKNIARKAKQPAAPAAGKLVASFGQRAAAGDARAGVTYQTRSGAQVLAPMDGSVEYAGRFRSYGNIVILDVGNGYLVVLAGMEKIYAQEGQNVMAREPVGHMNTGQSPRLYFEVRHNGKPIDPTRWIS